MRKDEFRKEQGLQLLIDVIKFEVCHGDSVINICMLRLAISPTMDAASGCPYMLQDADKVNTYEQIHRKCIPTFPQVRRGPATNRRVAVNGTPAAGECV